MPEDSDSEIWHIDEKITAGIELMGHFFAAIDEYSRDTSSMNNSCKRKYVCIEIESRVASNIAG